MTVLGQLQALIGALVIIVLIVLAARKTMFRGPRRRPRTTHNVLGVMDEVFAPARHDATVELRSRDEQGAVTPSPDDLPPEPTRS
jgi:hypothetical protein